MRKRENAYFQTKNIKLDSGKDGCRGGGRKGDGERRKWEEERRKGEK